MPNKPVTIAIVGAGSRGTRYSEYAVAHPDKAKIVAVAEPRDFYRESLVSAHHIQQDNTFKDWNELVGRGKIADAVIIATQDQMHRDPAVKFAELGYDILLEKPMAVTEQHCRDIVNAAESNNVLLSVCHVMRYTKYTCKLKQIIDSGAIGEIISIDQVEPVGYWHYAHSFVRGNWSNLEKSSFMLLTKCCHDIDWLRYIADSRIKKVSSFGSLKYFRKENTPDSAADRCVECPLQSNCPYSALKIYLEKARLGQFDWPNNVITSDLTEQGVLKAITEGPYGRCVYKCDNDVVDHQVVNMLFENQSTATLTMTAFTELTARKTRIFGTKGQLVGDGEKIEHYDFLTDNREVHNTSISDGSILSGHGGGDYEIIKSFVQAVSTGDNSKVLSGPSESLESHLAVFAAERARNNSSVVQL